jgi:general secretion pathway protein G
MVKANPMRAHRPGFTLIEMLVVMVVIALLLTLALPRYIGSLEQARERVLRENLKIMRVSLDKFYADRGRFPDTLADLVEHNYLRAVPIDPMTESALTWIAVPAADAEAAGVADVKSGAAGTDKEGNAYESL